MAPSLGCLNADASLICAEQAPSSDWEDEIESFNAAQQHVDGLETEASLIIHGVHRSDMQTFILGDHQFEEAEAEVVEHLMQKEVSFMPRKQDAESYIDSYDEELQESRQRAVCWILTVQACYGFYPCTVFLAVSYFDRFMASRQELMQKTCAPSWLMQLLAVGCLSLAAKVEEIEVPLLLNLQVGHVPHVFDARTIQRMELLILSTLKWRLSSVTPFSFLGFLFRKVGACGRSCFEQLLQRSEELVLNSCTEVRFVAYAPSVLAVGSLMCACDELLPEEAASYKHALISLWPNTEHSILECARLMQELVVGDDPFWTSTRRLSILSPSLINLSCTPESPNGVLDAGCFSYESGSTPCSSLKSSNKQALHGSGGAANCSTILRNAIDKNAAALRSPPAAPVCKATRFGRQKRKFNECYSTTCTRANPGQNVRSTQLWNDDDRFKEL